MTLANVRQRLGGPIDFVRRYGAFFAVALLILFAGIFLLSGRDELADVAQLLESVSLHWIVLLALLQVVILAIAGLTFKAILHRQGYRIGLLRLVQIQLQRVLVGTVTPVGGPASVYVLVRSLDRQGVPGSDSLIAASIRGISSVIAFALLLIPSFLFQTHSAMVTSAAVAMTVILIVLLVFIAVLLRQSEVPAVVQRHAPDAVLRFIDTAKSHQITAVDFVMPVLLGVATHLVTTVLLYVGLHAVGYQAPVGTVLIGYLIGNLFFMMAPVFQGVGVVELGTVLALRQAGVPTEPAMGAVLLYRVGDIWMPLSWAMVVEFVRTRLVRRSVVFASTTVERIGVALVSLPTQTPLLRRHVVALGHLALVTEAMLAISIGAPVILQASVSSVV